MGGLLVGEAWLLEREGRTEIQRAVCGRLLRMQILTANRSGHVLSLAWEPQRDAIIRAARWGQVAGLVLECADCHCQAVLHEWELAAKMTRDERRAKWAALRSRFPRHTLAYLARCPGVEVAKMLAASDKLPNDGGA